LIDSVMDGPKIRSRVLKVLHPWLGEGVEALLSARRGAERGSAASIVLDEVWFHNQPRGLTPRLGKKAFSGWTQAEKGNESFMPRLWVDLKILKRKNLKKCLILAKWTGGSGKRGS